MTNVDQIIQAKARQAALQRQRATQARWAQEQEIVRQRNEMIARQRAEEAAIMAADAQKERDWIDKLRAESQARQAQEAAEAKASKERQEAESKQRLADETLQKNLVAQTGGVSPITMSKTRNAATARPAIQPQLTFRAPAPTTSMQPRYRMPTATAVQNPQPFTFAPDLSRLTFGGR